MTVNQVHEALGSFELEFVESVPREILDAVEYFGHVAITPGRIDPRQYGDNTLDAARYVGVVRHKKLSDDGRTNLVMDDIRISGVGMNFWLGDENNKGDVIETPLTFTNASFNTAMTTLCPDSVAIGTIYSVNGTYSGRHLYETPRSAIQYVCDTMSSGGTPVYDTFNRGDTTNNIGQLDSGQVWTQDAGTWGIISNAAYISASASIAITTVPAASDFDAQVTVQTISSGFAYFVFRYSDASNYWRLGAFSPTGNILLEKVSSGTVTTVANLSNTMQNSTTLRIVASGDTIYAYVNGALVTQTTDSYGNSYTKLGMMCSATSTRFETFNVSPELSPISFRVNNNATLDAGPESSLFVTIPRCVIVRKGTSFGEDLTMRALPITLDSDQDMEDFATRTVMLAEANGDSIATGSADIATVSPTTNVYKDIYGNPLKLTKMVSESDTVNQNADVRAELALRQTLTPNRTLNLSTDDYDIHGTFEVGDYIYLYDPDAGFVDDHNEITIRGARINPMKLQVTETEWPITDQYSVAFRSNDGTWYDLTDYIKFEDTGSTKVVVGDFTRNLVDTSAQAVDNRLGSLTQPDTTIPAAPSFIPASFETVNYLDGNGFAKSSQTLVWTVPANTDGSAIADGDHYEVRYRLNTGELYSQTWGAVSNITWGEMNTWAEPVVASTVHWESRFIQWGTNVTTISGLASGTNYDFQVRAVDTGNNTSDWSSTETNVTPLDNIPPSTPNAPVVAASVMAVQIVHNMGKASGGEFNLEQDLAYLEVHVAPEPLFIPSDDTKIGNLQANLAMMTAHTPAVHTFSMPQSDLIYVKVVAVDQAGNRSPASAPATVSAELIDDQYITNLSVSKVTSGELTADWIISGSISTGGDGQRVELNSKGLQAYNAEGDLTTNLSSDPSTSGQYMAFLGSGGVPVASISSDGVGSFAQVTANNLLLGGQDLITDIIDPRPKGVVAWASDEVNTVTTNGDDSVAGNEKGYMELAFTAEANRMYQVTCTGDIDANSGDTGRRCWFRIRDGGELIPTITSPNVCTSYFYGPQSGSAGGGANVTGFLTDIRSYTPGVHRLLWSFGSNIPGSTVNLKGPDGPSRFWVEDLGDISYFQNTGKMNPGDGTSTAPPGGSGNYVRTYNATWSGSYNGSGSYMADYADRLTQGYYSSNRGNQRSLIGLPYTAIKNDMTGATVQKVELLLFLAHTYYDYGTDAILGTHTYTSRPSTWSAGSVSSDRSRATNWSGPSLGALVLTSSMAADIVSGTAKGIALGPGPNTDPYYYAFFNSTESTGNRPVLRITYSI